MSGHVCSADSHSGPLLGRGAICWAVSYHPSGFVIGLVSVSEKTVFSGLPLENPDAYGVLSGKSFFCALSEDSRKRV